MLSGSDLNFSPAEEKATGSCILSMVIFLVLVGLGIWKLCEILLEVFW